MAAVKYLLTLDPGQEPIGIQYHEPILSIYFRPLTYHAMRDTLSLFGWDKDQPDPPIAGTYKQRVEITVTRYQWTAWREAVLERIGTTAEMARAMRRFVPVRAFGRAAW